MNTRKCMGCGARYDENTDHLFCSPQCYRSYTAGHKHGLHDHKVGKQIAKKVKERKDARRNERRRDLNRQWIKFVYRDTLGGSGA